MSQSTDNSLSLRNLKVINVSTICLKVLTNPCPHGTWRLVAVSTICVSKYW